MAKRQKTTRFSIQGWDARHYRTTDAYVQAVQSLYDKATTAITRAAARGKIDPDKPFSFDMYPSVKKEMQRITEQLASRVTTVIESGSKKQWLFACAKNDGFISSIMDTSKLSKARLKKMQDRNLDALSAFQSRKVEGMNLSQRVWKYVDQYKAQMESALDVGLGEGRSADELSRDVRQNLREPNRLFRRVRDKRGNLVLSKNARAYHPGQGVYRSSYKNAMRLTRSEINMAYRESDYQRWQQLDFIVGFEIHRSNHEPLCKCDICSKLVGRYPKTFKFKGWHPQCMCYATPILMDEETFDANELGDLKAALHGTEYKRLQAKNIVSEMPKEFTEWVEQHIEAQKGWSSTPYFIRDNFVDGRLGKGLKIAMPTIEPSGKVDFHVPFEQLPVDERIKFNNEMTNRVNDDCDLIDACRLYGIDAAWYDQMTDEISIQHQYWRVPELNAARDRLKAQLMAKIEETRMMAQKILSEYEAAAKSAEEWVGDTTSIVRYARDTFNDEASEQYPNYKSILKSANGGALDVSKLRASVDKAKADYNKAIADAKACVAKYDGNVDVSSLKALINESRTTSRNAKVITTDITKEIERVETFANNKDLVAKNDNETAQMLGIEKGTPMTFEEADNHRANESCNKGRIEAWKEQTTFAMRKNDDNPYHINCQSCVVAHELRMRGLDVEAQPNYDRSGTKPTELSYDTNKIWIDPETGKEPLCEWMTNQFTRNSAKAAASAVKWYEEMTKTPGRYSLTYRWKVKQWKGGHIIVAERLADGTLRVYDPQTGRIRTLEDICKTLNWGTYRTCGIQRVDKMAINLDMIDGIVRKRQ